MNITKTQSKPKEKDKSDFKTRIFTFEEFEKEFYPKDPAPPKRALTPYEEGIELARRLVRFAPSNG